MEPGIKPAVGISKTKKIAILATANTIDSQRFTKLIERFHHQAEIVKQACPGFVELVEAGDIDSHDAKVLVEKYLLPLVSQDIDVLVLGCTHYPFLIDMMKRVGGSGVKIVDTGVAVAAHLKRVLAEKNLLNDCQTEATRRYYTTGDVAKAATVTRKILGDEQIQVLPLQLTLDAIGA